MRVSPEPLNFASAPDVAEGRAEPVIGRAFARPVSADPLAHPGSIPCVTQRQRWWTRERERGART
jgi:hypothetical protein